MCVTSILFSHKSYWKDIRILIIALLITVARVIFPFWYFDIKRDENDLKVTIEISFNLDADQKILFWKWNACNEGNTETRVFKMGEEVKKRKEMHVGAENEIRDCKREIRLINMNS